jgi:hypothetical protein
LGLKPGDPFYTIDDAAVDALDWVYNTYPKSQNEFAGTVYKGDDGRYYATDPKEGKPAESSPSYPKSGQRPLARYHTHAKCTPDHIEDEFSDGFFEDKWKADFWETPSYLGTPGGYRKRYDPDPNKRGKGNETTLREGCKCPGPYR